MMTINHENRYRGITRSLNVIGWLLVLLGFIATIFLLVRFYKGGMYAEPALEAREVLTSLVAGFYHWLFAFVCFGMGQILRKSKGEFSRRTIRFLQFFGWGAIVIGIVGAFIIFPSAFGMGPRVFLRILGAIAFVIYNVAFGLPCLGLAALLKKDSSEGVEQ